MLTNAMRTEAEDLDPDDIGFVDEDDYTIDCDSLEDMEVPEAGRSLRPHTLD